VPLLRLRPRRCQPRAGSDAALGPQHRMLVLVLVLVLMALLMGKRAPLPLDPGPKVSAAGGGGGEGGREAGGRETERQRDRERQRQRDRDRERGGWRGRERESEGMGEGERGREGEGGSAHPRSLTPSPRHPSLTPLDSCRKGSDRHPWPRLPARVLRPRLRNRCAQRMTFVSLASLECAVRRHAHLPPPSHTHPPSELPPPTPSSFPVLPASVGARNSASSSQLCNSLATAPHFTHSPPPRTPTHPHPLHPLTPTPHTHSPTPRTPTHMHR
jgi:hypothetical protein